MSYPWPALVVVVGSGGVGKTTLAAALALQSSREANDTLVMTFDPSLRLKDALGVSEAGREGAVEVDFEAPGSLHASLLDAKQAFDEIVAKYAPDAEARRRILENRYYQHLAGSLAGVLEYMAVERLFSAARSGDYDRIVLDTPPTRQALDFLEAPARIVGFLDSGALKLALRPWFDGEGHLRPTRRLGPIGARFERYLDEVVGLDLLRDMVEFFQAFEPLYDGFRERARDVEKLLRSSETRFLLVAGPGEEKIPDTLFFARRLQETGYSLGPIVVNRMHPAPEDPNAEVTFDGDDVEDGAELVEWLGRRDALGFAKLQTLVSEQPTVGLPLLPSEPTSLEALVDLADMFESKLQEAS